MFLSAKKKKKQKGNKPSKDLSQKTKDVYMAK